MPRCCRHHPCGGHHFVWRGSPQPQQRDHPHAAFGRTHPGLCRPELSRHSCCAHRSANQHPGQRCVYHQHLPQDSPHQLRPQEQPVHSDHGAWPGAWCKLRCERHSKGQQQARAQLQQPPTGHAGTWRAHTADCGSQQRPHWRSHRRCPQWCGFQPGGPCTCCLCL